MFNPIDSILKRFLRYIVDYAIAFGIQYVIGLLTNLQVPLEFQPVIAALIAALGKFFRIKTQLPIPF